jgi:cytochrome c553
MKTVVTLLSSLLLAAATASANEAAAPAKPDLAKGGATSAAVCSACHTADGSRGSPANPILQGQHAEYLVKQLTEFKSGKRKNAIMAGFAGTLSDEDMRNVAAFYASKSAKPGAAKNKDTLALGEKIYRGGIAERNVPACAAWYPRLGGQHADYVESQMNGFRSGARANGPMMMTIAAKMNDKEIKAVSDYVAGLH